MDMRVDEAQRRLQSMIELRQGWAEPHLLSRELQRLFKSSDTDNTGTMSPGEFAALLDKYGIGAGAEEAAALFARYDLNDNGLLTFAEFADGLFGVRATPLADAASRNIVATIRHALSQRGHGVQALACRLRTAGSVSKAELQQGLDECGCGLSGEDMDTVMSLFDANKDGRVSRAEFMAAVRGPLNSRRKELVAAAFATLDKNSDGTATMEELLKIYDVSQHPDVLSGAKTEEEALQGFISNWDGNRDAQVTHAEFLDYYKSVSASIDLDDTFELMMRNAWRIPGGQGVCENTANLRVLVTHTNGSQKVYCLDDSLGIRRTDVDKIKKSLVRQGVMHMKRIELSG